jgi:subfamily B ATP-binding cassette protein MsbA
MKSFLRILSLAKNYRGLALLNIGFNLLYALFALFSLLMVIPFLQVLFGTVEVPAEKPAFQLNGKTISQLFNYEFGNYIAEKGQVEGLILICAFVIVIFFLKNASRYLAMYFLAPLRNGVVRDLRGEVFGKVQSLPIGWFSDQRKGDVIARMTTDVTEVEWSIMNVLEAAFREPLLIIFFLIAMLSISPGLTLFVFILLPLTGLIIGRIGKSLKRPSQQAQEQVGFILSLIEETLSGLRIVKAFNAESFQEERFNKANQEHYRLQTQALHRRDLSSPLSEFLGIVVVAIVLWFGGRLVIEGKFAPEVFIGYIIIFANLINPAKAFANAFYYIQRGIASMERIETLLNAENNIEEAVDASILNGFNDQIEYDGVSFSYDGETVVLKDIDFSLKKGQRIALVGQSGSGKSTTVDLLGRFYDVNEGAIRIDGKDLRSIRKNDLRSLLGMVSQESVLFHDTVAANIAFGKTQASQKEIEEAAGIANAHDFISKLPQGYQTIIGDRGTKLSGGERQRLTIARAVLANPPILILDEATSSLDSESERLVQDALYKLMQNRTALIIAHRLSTIKDVDQILVLRDGKIIERGSHEELMQKDAHYAKLVSMQNIS